MAGRRPTHGHPQKGRLGQAHRCWGHVPPACCQGLVRRLQGAAKEKAPKGARGENGTEGEGGAPPSGEGRERRRERTAGGEGGEGDEGERPEGRGARFVVGERTLEPTTPSGLAHDDPNERETANQSGPLALLGTVSRPKAPRRCRKRLPFSFPCPCPVRGREGLTP